jgi:hypothetical protein
MMAAARRHHHHRQRGGAGGNGRGNVSSDCSTSRNIRHRARFVAGIGIRVDAPIGAAGIVGGIGTRVDAQICTHVGTRVGCARLVAPAAPGPGGRTGLWEEEFHHRHKTILVRKSYICSPNTESQTPETMSIIRASPILRLVRHSGVRCSSSSSLLWQENGDDERHGRAGGLFIIIACTRPRGRFVFARKTLIVNLRSKNHIGRKEFSRRKSHTMGLFLHTDVVVASVLRRGDRPTFDRRHHDRGTTVAGGDRILGFGVGVMIGLPSDRRDGEKPYFRRPKENRRRCVQLIE